MINDFIQAATKTGAVVDVIEKSPQQLQAFLKKKTSNVKNIIFAEPSLIPRTLFGEFAARSDIISNPTLQQLAESPLGIGEAFAGVARTGSVCISLDSPLLGVEGLIPFEHLVVLNANNIVQRPNNIFTVEDARKMRNGWVFITGPSATADMGELVKGAHGPAKLHIVILQ